MLRTRFWFSLFLLVFAGTAAAQDARLEARLKATFIYNFLQFVEWPAQAFSDNPVLTVCVVGPAFEPVMEETIRGETIQGRAIAVRAISSEESARGCHVIYIRESAGTTGADMLKAVRNSPVLTVGEDSEFMDNGGIIRFIEAGNRIRFAINPAAAGRASLTLSSRLLRLADIVRDPLRRAP